MDLVAWQCITIWLLMAFVHESTVTGGPETGWRHGGYQDEDVHQQNTGPGIRKGLSTYKNSLVSGVMQAAGGVKTIVGGVMHGSGKVLGGIYGKLKKAVGLGGEDHEALTGYYSPQETNYISGGDENRLTGHGEQNAHFGASQGRKRKYTEFNDHQHTDQLRPQKKAAFAADTTSHMATGRNRNQPQGTTGGQYTSPGRGRDADTHSSRVQMGPSAGSPYYTAGGRREDELQRTIVQNAPQYGDKGREYARNTATQTNSQLYTSHGKTTQQTYKKETDAENLDYAAKTTAAQEKYERDARHDPAGAVQEFQRITDANREKNAERLKQIRIGHFGY